MEKFLKRKVQSDPPPRDHGEDASESDDTNSEKEIEKALSAETSKNKKRRSNPNRKYDEAYLRYGFISTGSDDQQKPMCLVCMEVLANASMKPSKLMRHARTKHAETLKKPIEFFQRKRDEVCKQQSRFIKSATFNSAALKASFDVALRIAKAKKPHTIAEELILPSAIDIVTAVCGEKFVSKVRSVPLSNDTISRRISVMSCDVREQLVEFVKVSQKFALQLDESTDVANCAMLLVYIRYINIIEKKWRKSFYFVKNYQIKLLLKKFSKLSIIFLWKMN